MLLSDLLTSLISIFEETCRSNNQIKHSKGYLSWNISTSGVRFHHKLYDFKWRRRDCFYLKQWNYRVDGKPTFAIRLIYLKDHFDRLFSKVIKSNNFSLSNQWPSCFRIWTAKISEDQDESGFNLHNANLLWSWDASCECWAHKIAAFLHLFGGCVHFRAHKSFWAIWSFWLHLRFIELEDSLLF